ncbi:hypothetical protein BT96DRAFT_919111 [Gymnopus androsaceus JB14]|uniref:Uncharacterized protein n=1 Tax=Gymnopus androsaceus JB14 TaxID=1447944 RepID=A0A6A4HWI5_9AGAR|nr:hypothetical protein BT96DRAFT_919111 [Gymnopus androsaceus JB14]
MSYHQTRSSKPYSNSRCPTEPSEETLESFKSEFLEFYARAWAAGIRAQPTITEHWAPLIAERLSEGKTKIIIYNGCYGGRNFSEELEQKLKQVNKEVEDGTTTFHEYNDHGAIVEAAMRLGREVDDHQASETDPEKERIRILNLGLKAGSGSCANLIWTEIPLFAAWRIDEYDGYEWVVIE